jgi:MFS family permease
MASAAPASATASNPTRFAFRSEGYAWFVVAILCLGGVTSMLERQVINLLVEPLKVDLRISDTQISLLQGFAFAIFYALMALPIGRIIDARSRVAVIVWGTLIFSLATFFCGLATGFLMLVVARTMVGIGEATLTPAGMSMLGDYFPQEKLGRAVGLFIGSTYAGSGLALIIIGAVLGWLDQHPDVVLPVVGMVRDWQLAFMLAALPGILFIAAMTLVREPPRSSASGEAVGNPVPLRETLAMMASNWGIVLPLFLGIPLLAAANFAMNAWVPTFFIRTYGWSAAEIGPVFGLMVILCGTGGTVLGGAISDALARRGVEKPGLVVPVISALLAAPFIAGFALAGEARLSLILLVPAMAFGAMPFGAGTAGIVSFAPNRMRGQMVAIYMLIATLIGTGGGPWVIAAWTDGVLGDPALIRWSIAVVATALFVLGAAIIATGLRVRSPRG